MVLRTQDTVTWVLWQPVPSHGQAARLPEHEVHQLGCAIMTQFLEWSVEPLNPVGRQLTQPKLPERWTDVGIGDKLVVLPGADLQIGAYGLKVLVE